MFVVRNKATPLNASKFLADQPLLCGPRISVALSSYSLYAALSTNILGAKAAEICLWPDLDVIKSSATR